MGICYEEGLGVDIDLEEARDWYARAAEQGHKAAKKAYKKLSWLNKNYKNKIILKLVKKYGR